MSEVEKTLQSIFNEHLRVATATFEPKQLEALSKITDILYQALKRGNKILLCGNGGSAADSQHIAAEFIVRFKRERRSLPAISLTTDTSVLTATANDYDYKVVFKRQVEGLGREGDVLIAISTSGNSENILLAAKEAKQMKMKTVGLTGASGGKLASEVDICFKVASPKTPHIQEMHITALHAISEAVEDQLFK